MIIKQWKEGYAQNLPQLQKRIMNIEDFALTHDGKLDSIANFDKVVAGWIDHGRVGKRKGSRQWIGFSNTDARSKQFFLRINEHYKIDGQIKPRDYPKEPNRKPLTHFRLYDTRQALKLLKAVLPYVTRGQRVVDAIAACERELR